MSDPAPRDEGSTLDFRLLGPFEIWVGDQPRVVSGRGEQSLLALMLLSPGQVLPAPRLVDLLWEDANLPADPLNALQSRISKTRRALAGLGAESPALVTVAGGYRLDVARSAVDVHRFTDQVEAARRAVTAAPAAAESQLAAALSLWRGTALSGLEGEPWAAKERHRLHDLRLTAAEERLSLAIATGRQREVIDEIRSLVDENPMHEGMTHLLMRALYLSGRQAEALQAYQDLRRTLDDELGLEPSVHLRDLESSILRQDAELGRPVSGHAPLAAGSTSTPASDVAAKVGPRPSRRPRALPNRVSSFVGREEDTTRLLALVDEAQIVTLVGTGGAGKTSLAVEVARRMSGRFEDGVTLVELAALSDEADVAQTVADTLAVAVESDAADVSVTDQLAAHLAGRSTLVVVDNCEHVIQACAELVDAVTARSGTVHVLATSREPLGVPGEVVYRLQTLATPPAESDGVDVRRFAAVQLFLDRMLAANPASLALTPQDEDAIAAICRSLDGIPLAIELAAARTTALSPAEIAERLVDWDRFSLLTMSPRTVESRQRTLRATVDWSYGLLSAGERVLLRRLSVYRGGFTLEAAEVVTAGDDLARTDVLHLLGQLVHRSLVVPEPGRQRRFSLLETIRAYAYERLTEEGEAEGVHGRHAAWVLDLAERSEAGLRGPRQGEWLARMQTELDNIRGALRWSAEVADDRTDLPWELVGSLGWFFHLGRHVEGREALRRLESVPGGAASARARAQQAAAIVHRPRASLVHPDPACAAAAAASLETFERHGDRCRAALSRTLLAVEGAAAMPLDEALQHLEVAGADFADLDDRWGQAFTTYVRLAIEIKHGTPESAQRWGARAVEAFDGVEDSAALSAVRFHLGLALRQNGRHREAIAQFREAARLAEPLGLYATVQWSLTAAGVSAIGLDELEEAAHLFEEAVRTRSERGDPAAGAHAAQGAGLIARCLGDHGEAHRHFRTAYAAYCSLGTSVSIGAALSGIAWASVAGGDLPAAEEALREMRTIADDTDDSLVRAWGFEASAQVAAATGDAARALALLDEAEEIRRASQLPSMPFEQREAHQLRAQLGRVDSR